MTPEQAERIAVQAFVWLSSQEDLVRRFMLQTGADPADLRRMAGEEGFAVAVLDFVLGDDSLTRAFAQAADLPPEAPLAARHALPGAAEPHWT